VTLPLVEIRLAESEMAHQCPSCYAYEKPTDPARYRRCGKCKQSYYVSDGAV
jgi:hypothetical protein